MIMLTSATRRVSRLASTNARKLSTLLVAEHDGTAVSEGTLSAVTAASALGPIHLLVGGEGSKAVADSAKAVAGVASVSYVESASLTKGLAEEWAPVVMAAQKAEGCTHVVAAASAFSKSVLPRVAALLDVAQISDVLEVKDESTFVRPMYAGNALSTVTSADDVKVMTIRPTVFDKAAREGGGADVKEFAAGDAVSLSEWVSEEVLKSDRPDLATASTVIAGGRGLKTGDNFSLLDSLGLKLNAAIGASRAAVDAGMCPNDMQIGQTGKVVAPDLYIAVGISGAIQVRHTGRIAPTELPLARCTPLAHAALPYHAAPPACWSLPSFAEVPRHCIPPYCIPPCW